MSSSSSPDLISTPLPDGGGGVPLKTGGSVWIYVILIVVGLVFVIGTIVTLAIAIWKRPRQLYLSKPQEPKKEVFVVLFDENSISGHINSGNDVQSAGAGAISKYPQQSGTSYNGQQFSYSTDNTNGLTLSTLQNLITGGTTIEPLNGLATQIGKDLTIATLAQCKEAANGGAVFKYLVSESSAPTDSGNYVDLQFLILESFSLSSYDNAFYKIDGDTKTCVVAPQLTNRLSIAFYGVKPTFGDFVTRQGGNNPTAIYLSDPTTRKFLPSATFKAPWLSASSSSPTPVLTYNFRIVPFNSVEFNKFVSSAPNYEATDKDGKIKWWSANLTA